MKQLMIWMKKMRVVMLLLAALMVMVGPAMALDLPNLYGVVGYDFVMNDMVAGASSDLLSWSVLDLNVGYLTSNTDQIWVGGVSVDIKGLAEKFKLTYGWDKVKARIGFYTGYDFTDKRVNYGIQIAVLEL